jgi:hypothetical protein
MFRAGAPVGLHHAAMFCESYDGVRDGLVAASFPLVSEFHITAMDAMFSYVDSRPLNGHFLELYHEHAGIRAMYQQTRDGARIWDGKDLIIPWG